MKFKKQEYPYEFHHYTKPRFAREIVKNGFDENKNPSELGRVYAFDADDDQNSKGLSHWTDTAIAASSCRFRDYGDRKQSQMGLLGGYGGNLSDYNTPQVRIVGKSREKPVFMGGRSSVITNESRSAGEKHVYPEDIDKESLKIQIPFGAVNKFNYKDFAEQLKGVDPSKIDMDDTYTRRIIKAINNPNIDRNIKSAREKTTELIKQGKIDPKYNKSLSRRFYLDSILNKLSYDKLDHKTNKEIKDPSLRYGLAEQLLFDKDRKNKDERIRKSRELILKKQIAMDEFKNDHSQLLRGIPGSTPFEKIYNR